MKYFLATLTLLICSVIFSQVSDDFSDLDFSSNPTWGGTTADFIVNASEQVQLNASVAGTSYLSTSHALASLDDREWRCWLRIGTAPSSSNFGRFYLTATTADLTSNPDGFYLQLGEAGSTDAVRLMKSSGGISTQICAASDGSIAASFIIGVRVVRNNAGLWNLSIDPSGGEAYALVASGSDTENLLGTHLGYLCTYTASNATKYYFDEVYAGDEILDTQAPTVVSVTAVNANLIDVVFSEAVNPATSEDENNYDIQPFQSVTSATVDGGNPALVHLVPAAPLSNGTLYTLFTSGIQDLFGNASASEQNEFGYFIAEAPEAGDVIINEFMCDPSPVVGLPELEFVEIYNRSTKIFNLQDWQLGDNSTFGTVQNAWLLPGQYTVLCSTAAVDSFAQSAAVTSFPGLNNAGDDIVLRDNTGLVLDKISYTDDWYNDPSKDDGGYTIERINPQAPCTGSNGWHASSDPSGGTPGGQNSVFDLTADTQAPGILEVIALTGSSVEVQFNEQMDSLSLINATVSVNPFLAETVRSVSEPFPTSMDIQFSGFFEPGQLYTLTIQNMADCWMNTANGSAAFALPDSPEAGDVVINELLFNPLTGGSDWIELYNNSEKLLNLKNWIIANFDDDTIANEKVITTDYLLWPDEYVVIGADSQFVLQNYPAAIPGSFLQLSLPSFNNDSSTVFVLYPFGFQNNVMDKVSYTDDWHFKLLDDDDGKSLERLDPDADSQQADNWHTAAEAIGFGTPGGRNSQYYPAVSNGSLSFTSETFSPDNDGFEDVLQINYELETSGLVGTITIYDDRGRKIKDLMTSELLGVNGTVLWDGVDNDGVKASIGTYVLVFEAFKVDGGLEFVKRKAFVLAGKL